jgi:hypothetical protein
MNTELIKLYKSPVMVKSKKSNMRKRIGIYAISYVLPFITVDRNKIEFDGKLVRMNSLRYHTFKKSIKCVNCGIEGKYFALEQNMNIKEGNCYHFNLYAINNNGEEVLMTKDHILPVSKGGKDYIDNLQTMCTFCNFEKDNNI